MEQEEKKSVESVQIEAIKIDYSGMEELQTKIKKADSLITELRNVLNEISNANVDIKIS